MPRHTKYMWGFYIGSAVTYNITSSYLHAKKALQLFREDKLPAYHVKTEWDAVKYGSNQHVGERLLNSIFWPITMTSNIVPFVVLMVNPKENS